MTIFLNLLQLFPHLMRGDEGEGEILLFLTPHPFPQRERAFLGKLTDYELRMLNFLPVQNPMEAKNET